MTGTGRGSTVARATKSSLGGIRGLKRRGIEQSKNPQAASASNLRESVAVSERSCSPSSVEGPEQKRSKVRQQLDADDAASVSETSDITPSRGSSPRRWLLQSTSRPAAHQTRGARSAKESKPDFLEDFDPDSSSREMRKVHRRIAEDRLSSGKMQTLYDSHGLFLEDGSDLCDCLEEDCPGCFFPCPSCGSGKCGFACRCNRRWMVESIEIDGTGIVRSHPYKPIS